LHQFPDIGFFKYTFLDFCFTQIWQFIPHIFHSTPGFIDTLHKDFLEAQLYMQRGRKFSPEEQEENDDIFLPWRQ